MEFRFLPIFAIALVLAVAVSNAALPAEMYWTSVFPNAPMPKALRNHLLPAAGNKNDMLTDMVKNKDKVVDSNGKYAYANPSMELADGNKNDMLADMVKNKDKVVDSNGKYAYANPSMELADGNKNDMLADMVKNKDKVVDSNGKYAYANPSKELAVGTNKDVYFFESKLHPGRKMNIKELTRKASKAAFLPRPVADSIPFSTQKFAEILKYFSVEPKSAESNLLKQTIENCERPAIKGEEKYCATSLESFVDSGVSKLGKNIQLLSNELQKETQNQEFTIGQGVKMVGESEIVCHKMVYAYAVFLCHSIDKTAVYTVPLVGADGTRARALAVCHKDTSAWHPKHLAFQILKVKPGTVPICHFLARETLIWVPKN